MTGLKQQYRYSSILMLALIAFPTLAAAVTLKVNTTADVIGPAGSLNLRCLEGVGECSLRDATKAATGNPGPDIILLDAKTYSLTLGEISIVGDTEIHGVNKNTTIIKVAPGKKSRVLNISFASQITLENLTVRDGFLANTAKNVQTGAGIRANNVGRLRLIDVNVRGNLITSPVKVNSTLPQASALYLKNVGLTLERAQVVFNKSISPNTCVGEFCCIAFQNCAVSDTIYIENDNSIEDIIIRNSFIEENHSEGISESSPGWLINGDLEIDRSRIRNSSLTTSITSGAFYDDQRVVHISESTFDNTISVLHFDLSPDPLLSLSGNAFNHHTLLFRLSRHPEWGPAGNRRPSVIVNNTINSEILNGLLDGSRSLQFFGALAPNQSAKGLFRPIHLLHNTIVANSSEDPVIEVAIVDVILQNNILYNRSPKFSASVCEIQQSNSVSGGGNVLFSGSGNIDCPQHPDDVIADPLLLPIALNGGWSMTMALPEQSPAVDAAEPLNSVPFDQRAKKRPVGFGADSGAYELQTLPPPEQ